MLIWLLSSLIFGLILSALALFLIYTLYIRHVPVVPKAPFHAQFEDFSIPNALLDLITSDKSESISALNVLLHFLFQELKDTGRVRNYIIRKMTAEFKELLASKTAGKIIEKITARDFSLGTGCPIIKSLKLESMKCNEAKTQINEFSLLLDLEYKDGFSISVDVDLILGRSAYVHIKVASLKGRARLRFTREPFTHWCFSFIDDPNVQFAVSSHFDGRQITQLTTLIINQLRRSIKKKHTWPNYKMRFKPFFDQPSLQKNDSGDKEANTQAGTLKISFKECERISEALLLSFPNAISYLTLSLDEHSCESLLKLQINKNEWPLYEVELRCVPGVPDLEWGIRLAETYFLNQSELVVVEIGAIGANGANAIKLFDICVAVNGNKVNTLKQMNKVLKSVVNGSARFQFQKPVVRFDNRASKVSESTSYENVSSCVEGADMDANANVATAAQDSTDDVPRNLSSSDLLNKKEECSQNTSKMHLVANTRNILGQRLRSFRQSNATNTTEESVKNTENPTSNVTHLASAVTLIDYYNTAYELMPSNKEPLDFIFLMTNETYTNDDLSKRKNYFRKSTKELKFEGSMMFEDQLVFELNEKTRYVNLCMWASSLLKGKSKNYLIGYISVPVSEITSACWTTMKGEAFQQFHFRPVDTKASAISRTHTHVLNNHAGFDTSLTYGSIKMHFSHNVSKNTDVQNNINEEIKKRVEDTTEKLFEDANKDTETQMDLKGGTNDRYAHKFVYNLLSNEEIQCKLCLKKIWFKNGYRCGYCGFVIHLKCYEKAISSTICPRYSNEIVSNQASMNGSKTPDSENSDRKNDFIMVDDCDNAISDTNSTILSKAADTVSLSSGNSNSSEGSKRKAVKNFFNDLRHRKFTFKDRSTNNSNNNNNNSNIININSNTNSNNANQPSIISNSEVIQNLLPKLKFNDGSSIEKILKDEDLFEDIKSTYCNDKNIGSLQLLEDLPTNERRQKLEEMSIKYQSTLEMMTRLKESLENELKTNKAVLSDEKQRLHIESQIKHHEDQMKPIVFLLIRCHEGIEQCLEMVPNDNNNLKIE